MVLRLSCLSCISSERVFYFFRSPILCVRCYSWILVYKFPMFTLFALISLSEIRWLRVKSEWLLVSCWVHWFSSLDFNVFMDSTRCNLSITNKFIEIQEVFLIHQCEFFLSTKTYNAWFSSLWFLICNMQVVVTCSTIFGTP